MAKTKDRLTDTAENIRPYVERAVKDEQLRDNVRDAFGAAREVYNELIGPRGTVSLAVRVASDEDIQDTLRGAVDDLRKAANRLQGQKDHSDAERDAAARGHRARDSLQSRDGTRNAELAEGPHRRRRRGLHLPGQQLGRHEPDEPDDSDERRLALAAAAFARAVLRGRRREAAEQAPVALGRDGGHERARDRARSQTARGRDVGDLEQDRSRLRRGRRPRRPAAPSPRRPETRCPRTRRHASRYGYGATTPS